MLFSQLLWVVVFAVGLVQGVFLCFTLVSLPGKNKSGLRFIALIVIASALMIGEELFEVSRWNALAPHVVGSTMLLPLLMGPWVFFFSRSIAKEQQGLSRIDYLHFLPFVYFAIDLSGFYLLPADQKIEAVSAGLFLSDPGIVALTVFKAIHLFLYLFLSVKAVNTFKKSSKEHHNTQRQLAVWAARILYAMIVCMAIMYGFLVLNVLGYPPYLESDQFGSLILTLLIYVLAFTAIKYPVVLSGADRFREIQKTLTVSLSGEVPYQFSSLDEERKKIYLSRLLTFMDEEKPYTNPNIRLDDIADALSVPAHHLSQVINEMLSVNFNEFINAYRVEAVKEKLVSPAHAHFSILALAFEAGFNSKTSFNRIFKQFTGLTPSLYKSQKGTS